jgi:uncharacterized protein (DUF302 family)
MKSSRRLFLKQITGCCIIAYIPIQQKTMMNTQGIITRISPYGVKETIDRLVIFLEKGGATVYCRINQQNEVSHSGREILPMEFILFGNPANGGAVMAANPLAALDLPLKILAWEDAEQVVKVAYNDSDYLQQRYTLPLRLTAPLDLTPLITKALA